MRDFRTASAYRGCSQILLGHNDSSGIKAPPYEPTYLDIRRGFYPLERELPTIHLSGENEVEAGKISHEIDVAVRSRIAGMDRLSEKERAVLEEELTRVPNHTDLLQNCTYLWVDLIFDEIQQAVLLTPTRIRL